MREARYAAPSSSKWEELIVSRPGQEAYTVTTVFSDQHKRDVNTSADGVPSTPTTTTTLDITPTITPTTLQTVVINVLELPTKMGPASSTPTALQHIVVNVLEPTNEDVATITPASSPSEVIQEAHDAGASAFEQDVAVENATPGTLTIPAPVQPISIEQEEIHQAMAPPAFFLDAVVEKRSKHYKQCKTCMHDFATPQARWSNRREFCEDQV